MNTHICAPIFLYLDAKTPGPKLSSLKKYKFQQWSVCITADWPLSIHNHIRFICLLFVLVQTCVKALDWTFWLFITALNSSVYCLSQYKLMIWCWTNHCLFMTTLESSVYFLSHYRHMAGDRLNMTVHGDINILLLTTGNLLTIFSVLQLD